MKLLTTFRKSGGLTGFLVALLLPGMTMLPVTIQANPEGASVISGNISMTGLGTSTLTINQTSNAALINWNSFSIGSGELTRFVQPSVNSIAINRVISGNPTAIYGQLQANGGVMVINPNGIMIGPGGVIDVGGLLNLSTLDASDTDLLSGGSMRFYGSGGAGVTNYGSISARDAVLMGNYVDNQGNIVGARSAILAAGGDMILGQTSNGATISVRGGGSGATGVKNSGSVEGGSVDMVANGNAYSMAINNSGAVRAKGYNFSGGKLTLSAGNRSGSIINTGSLQARNQDGRGGQINIEGGNVNLASGQVDASGELGSDGGTVDVKAVDLTVGSDSLIMADGVTGGTVSLDATGTTTMAGTVSSKGSLGDGGRVDLAGNQVNLAATAEIDVSGLIGGQVRIGGGFQGNDRDIRNSTSTNVAAGAMVIADGRLGDGGQVIFWSDGDTMFGGEVSARATGYIGNGGFVEVSGKNQLSFFGFADTRAASGINGTLLLDPRDIIIGPAGTSVTFTDAAVVALLVANNVVIHTSGSGGAAGDITILPGSNLQYTSANSLTFFAHRNIIVNSDIKNHGTGHINLIAGWGGPPIIPPNTPLFIGNTNPDTGKPTISRANILAGTYGTHSNNGGSIYLNTAVDEPVEVVSAGGEENFFSAEVFRYLPTGKNKLLFSDQELRQAIDNATNDAAAVAYDWPYGLFEYDGYEGHWGNLAASDAIEDIYVPRSGIEERLDAAFGPRQGGLVPSAAPGGTEGISTPGFESVATQERNEDNERMANRALQKVGKSVQTFYLYEPGSNVYSSLRIFGVPSADVPAFSPGQ